MVTVAEGLAFAEGPRWHDGTLYWSDMHGHVVQRLAGGRVETVCEVPNRPSGLGWMPDGRMLIVSMADKRLLRLEADGSLALHADLSALAPRSCNDMVVDAEGRAYVGNFGFEIGTDGESEEPRATVLIRVDPDGTARAVADDLLFPNGAVITPDGRTLIIAETWRACLTAFDIDAVGDLSNRRLWAQLPEGAVPDGICLDAQGAVWAASPTTNECLRIAEGGDVLDRVETPQKAFACALGGAQGGTLYVCIADSHDPLQQRTERNGKIVTFAVSALAA